MAPTASVMNGAAGFAYALLRMAAVHDDGELLALADVWSTAALRDIGSSGAFCDDELQLNPETFGERSFYHHERACTASRRSSPPPAGTTSLGVARSTPSSAPPADHARTLTSRSGGRVAPRLCPARGGGASDCDTTGLRALGDGLATSVAHELEVEPVIGDGRALVKLGAAHGWAGWLYALLRWHVVTGTAAAGSVGPAALRRRLDELAAFGQVHGRGVYWPLQTAAPVVRGPLAASWCNGAAGYVPLWSLAHRAFGTTFMPG